MQCKSKPLNYNDEESILKHNPNAFPNYYDKKMWYKMEHLFRSNEPSKDDAGFPL